mgnify:CR=1 FL=1
MHELIDKLSLLPHPEGGFYRETYRSSHEVLWNGEKLSAGTAILFLLLKGQKSWCHRIPQDEIWHFYEGDPLELVYFNEVDLKFHSVILSNEIRTCTVPGGWWQAARPLGNYSLIGCTVSPGFEFRFFELLSADYNKRELFRKTMADFRKFEDFSS